MIRHACGVYLFLSSLDLSLFFSHSGHANMDITKLLFTELIENFILGISWTDVGDIKVGVSYKGSETLNRPLNLFKENSTKSFR